MSSPEQQITMTRQTLRPYVPGGIEFVNTTVNKGRLPKAERTLSNRERREHKNKYTGRMTLATLANQVVSLSTQAEGILFTHVPPKQK